jgi:hypothetical protein
VGELWKSFRSPLTDDFRRSVYQPRGDARASPLRALSRHERVRGRPRGVRSMVAGRVRAAVARKKGSEAGSSAHDLTGRDRDIPVPVGPAGLLARRACGRRLGGRRSGAVAA